jgi:DNA/RNA endonuclease YhcR with UshA esterase domain
MRASLLSLLLVLFTAGSLSAADITPEDAGKHVGERVTVRSTVFQVFVSKSKNVYLNFGAKFPNQTFAAAVLIQKTPALLADGPDWFTALEGKEVAVTGVVELYKGKPEIVLKAREDVKAAEGK